MIKKIVIGTALALSFSLVYADDECPNAVDAADSLNQNAYKNCDYSKTGLNGVIHRALAKQSDDAEKPVKTVETESKKADVDARKVEIDKKIETESKKVTVKVLSSSNEFSSAEQLQQLRFAIIQKAIQECTKGFAVDAENYLPVDAKRVKLELNYHCL